MKNLSINTKNFSPGVGEMPQAEGFYFSPSGDGRCPKGRGGHFSPSGDGRCPKGRGGHFSPSDDGRCPKGRGGLKNLLFLLTFNFLLLTPSFAQQGAIQLPATGQTTSYYPGDDGDLQIGVPIPANRFTDNGDGSATDALTGLMWATDANLIASRDPDFDQDRTVGDGDINWKTALNYVQKLNTENYLGHNDWRMPNYMELRSLVNLENDSITFPFNHPFTNLKEGYWSSTTPDGRRSAAISVFLSKYYVHTYLSHPAGDFQDMNKNLDLSSNDYYKLYLLPVRDGTATGDISIPQSGQKLTYCAGDDVDISSGVPWPSPRLIDNKDGSVTDRLTGLMWTKETFPMYTRDSVYYEEYGNDWTSSLDYIAKLNNENYLGYNDWRMPNLNELASLIDCSSHSQNLPQNNPFTSTWPFIFHETGHVLPSGYWTSGTLARDQNFAWIYYFDQNSLYSVDKTLEKNVWPVRTDNSSVPIGSINGTIEGAGLPKEAVEIFIEGPVNSWAAVGEDGHYSFDGLPNGNYTLTPSHLYFTFTPEFKTVDVSASSEICNFTASYKRAYGWVDISSNLFPLENAAGAGLSDIYFINDSEGWITASSQPEIYHTTDGGLSFELQTTQFSCNAIHMIDENEGYAGGANGRIYRTTDGGENWIAIGSISVTLTDIDFASSTQGYACGDGGAVFSITPEGVANLNSGLASPLSGISSPSADNVWVCGNAVISYYNGSTFTFQSGPTGSYNALCFINDDEGWVVGNSGLIGGTNDGGNAWKGLTPLNSESLYGVYTPNGIDVWTVGTQGIILHSPNGDDFWWHSSQDQGNNVVWNIEGAGLTDAFLRGVIFTSTDIGYATGNNGTLLKYTLLDGAPEGADILGIKLPGQVGEAIVNKQQRTVTAEVLNTTDITKLVPEIYPSAGATVDPPSGIKQDFTSPVVYKITASDGSSKNWTVTVTGVDGVEEDWNTNNKIEIRIYPNPARSVVSLQSSVVSQQSSVIEIYDLNGRKLIEKQIPVRPAGGPSGTETVEIDVSNMASGVYFCTLKTNKGNATKKLIIQK